MKHFFKLNKHKVFFAYKLSSIVFTTLAIVMFIIAFLSSEIPSNFIIAITFLNTIIIIPFFILLAAYIEWYSSYKNRKKIFSNTPFDKINEIGFENVEIKNETKYFFTEEIKTGVLSEYNIVCDVKKGCSKVLQFCFLIDLQTIENNQITEFCNQHNIEFNYCSFIKEFDTEYLDFNNITGLKNELEKFITLLTYHKFTPLK
ncbi:MAG: hypothetical protein HRT69_09425 [Flavobacteriaceae bacterium]|nr:hypothetical protein [Flavobacteriaceae bacterium]